MPVTATVAVTFFVPGKAYGGLARIAFEVAPSSIRAAAAGDESAAKVYRRGKRGSGDPKALDGFPVDLEPEAGLVLEMQVTITELEILREQVVAHRIARGPAV
jgi:hypothetical protein